MTAEAFNYSPPISVTSLKRKVDRDQLLVAVTYALTPYDIEIQITPYSDRHFVALFFNNKIAADVDFDGNDPLPSAINWCRAAAPLAPVDGLWEEHDINPSHRRKSTSNPSSYSELVALLVAGFAAASDGRAFIIENPCDEAIIELAA